MRVHGARGAPARCQRRPPVALTFPGRVKVAIAAYCRADPNAREPGRRLTFSGGRSADNYLQRQKETGKCVPALEYRQEYGQQSRETRPPRQVNPN